MNRLCISACLVCLTSQLWGESLPRAKEPATVVLPDYGASVRAFDEPDRQPVAWWPHVVNAAWGGGSGGPERRGGWIDNNWPLVDYLDRSADYTTHDYLTNRGIWHEVYGSNEYQETIHFHEEGARRLFWNNGIARDPTGQRVLSKHYNMEVEKWANMAGFNAFIVCNNGPRWSAIINYDWLTSPLLGYAISQDNIGGPTSRIGAGGHGRYCDFCSAKFFHYLETEGKLPEFRREYDHIREYVQANLSEVLDQLPPKARFRGNADEADLLAALCAPPVMAEYQKFLYLSHLHNMTRYYGDAKLVARRAGRDYDVHGNQGGWFIGPNPYQVALADFVDTVWFESSGLSTYDVIQHGWNNSAGAFRYQIGYAMTGGRKPFMSMTRFAKHTADLVEHEMAEACAGGGVLFVRQTEFDEEPHLVELMTDYFQFRHDHRAIYTHAGKRPHAQVALAYSVPTMMYRNYQTATSAPPNSAMVGVARAMEEGHIPLDVVIFNHPEIHADRATLDDLRRYKLILLPALECLSDGQIDLLTRYVRAGGTLGLIGSSGVRDEHNIPRSQAAEAIWRTAGRVRDILPGENFSSIRAAQSDHTRRLTQTAIDSVKIALEGDTILSGDLPRMLWVKTWKHDDGFAAFHFLNYDIDFESGAVTPTQPVGLTVTLPDAIPSENANWLTADGKSQSVLMSVDGNKVSVTLPSIHVYGVLVIGQFFLDRKASYLLQGDAMTARTNLASRDVPTSGDRLRESFYMLDEAAAYAETAATALQTAQAQADHGYVQGVTQAATGERAVLAFDFGGEQPPSPWKAVAADSRYSAQVGFGWLAGDDESDPTPEERDYAMAHRHGGTFATEVTPGILPFWPYEERPPQVLRANLSCGARRRFRVDLPQGDCRIRVITTNASWTNRNFFVSGMVAVSGEVRLLDAVHDKGSVVAREFSASAPDGKLEFAFGGPTGWAVAALVIERSDSPAVDPQVADGLRTWYVSPRYANPDWYPISQVTGPPEERLASVPDGDWTRIAAPPSGLPVVDLGTNRQAEVGDIVYAATTIQAASGHTRRLHFGASCQAQLWLNGKPLGYVPNEKGLRRDEFIVPLDLKPGKNVLVVKLERFWERRWVFYGSLTPVD
jgi:glycosyl hydrolase family 42 (putative beta-galactosidase)